MSEKRFTLDVRMDMPKLLIDNATNKRYHLLLVNDIEEIVDLLNEQSERIKSLEMELDLIANTKLFSRRKLEEENEQLKEENEQLRKELNDCEKFRYTVFKRMGELNDE